MITVDSLIQIEMRGLHYEIHVIFLIAGDALHDALQMQWPMNVSRTFIYFFKQISSSLQAHDEVFEEKIVILFTADGPNGLFTKLEGADPWVTSNELREKNVTLFVVGAGSCAMAFDDFYCALAENTGDFISCVLSSLILRILFDFRRFFRSNGEFRNDFFECDYSDVK